jgi:hypothetical protein
MRMIFSKISGSLSVLMIICFFLPFVAVSCNNKAVLELTGIQLITGTKLKTSTIWRSESKSIPAQPLARVAFGFAVAGLMVAFFKRRFSTALKVVFAVGAAVSLLLLKMKLDGDLLKYPKMLFYLDYLPCYWAALTIALVLAAVNGVCFFLKREES